MKLSDSELRLLQKAGYSEKIIRLYEKVPNFGFIEDPDTACDYKGPCGDIIKYYLMINENDVIKRIRFQYIGCPALAASGSALAKMVRGKSLQNAAKITENDVLKELERLPNCECHCTTLAVTALRKTIANYQEGVSKRVNKTGGIR
jgi:nitrogen fixation NifU-like protein